MDERKRHRLPRTPASASEPRPTPNKKQKTQIEPCPSDAKAPSKRRGVPRPIDLYAFQLPDRTSPFPPLAKSKDGHFRFHHGDSIGSRYKILSMMGEGTFGRVLECWDRKLKDTVAIKVIRSVPKYRDCAMIELEVLNTLTQNDSPAQQHCVQLQHWFEYRGHVCIVFQKLGSSLFDFLRRNGYRPFPLDVVQHMSRQLLQAIAYMHSLNIVHTDLKPENVLLVNSMEAVKLDRERCGRLGLRVPLCADIKVIDFGSATFNNDRHSSVVSTRHYRAPEVILGLGWSFECDLWSVGCIIVELITGRALFQTHENLEHLAMMEKVLEKIPVDMVKSASKDARKYFDNVTLAWHATASRKSSKAVQQLCSLKRLIQEEADSSVVPYLHSLHDLLAKMLRFRPQERWGARACLEHDFFRENIRSLLPKQDTEEDGQRSAPTRDSSKHATDSRKASEVAAACSSHETAVPLDAVLAAPLGAVRASGNCGGVVRVDDAADVATAPKPSAPGDMEACECREAACEPVEDAAVAGTAAQVDREAAPQPPLDVCRQAGADTWVCGGEPGPQIGGDAEGCKPAREGPQEDAPEEMPGSLRAADEVDGAEDAAAAQRARSKSCKRCAEGGPTEGLEGCLQKKAGTVIDAGLMPTLLVAASADKCTADC